MASLTITDNKNFPSGTVVTVYPSKGRSEWPGFPPAAQVFSGTVTSGALTVTGLVHGQSYFARGDNGKNAVLQAAPELEYVPTITGERDDPEAALKNLLEGGDDAGLWVDGTTED